MSNLYERLPKYIQIKETIRGEIETGVMREGEQLPSELDLIERFGASKMTVIRALQELVQEGFLSRVQGKGTFVRRPPGESPLLGVIVPNTLHGVFSVLLPVIEAKAHALGYGVMLCNAGGDRRKAETFTARLIERGAEGLVAAPIDGENIQEINEGWFDLVRSAKMPLVLADSGIPGLGNSVVVDTNNREAMRQLTREAKKRGHRRILFVKSDSETCPPVIERIEGFLEAANDPLHRAEMAEVVSVDSELPLTGAVESFERALSDFEPTLIMASNDLLAIQLMGILNEGGNGGRRGVSLTGFGDLPFAAGIGLATVRQPLDKIGGQAVDLLHRMIHGDKAESMRLPSKVVIRSSLKSAALA